MPCAAQWLIMWSDQQKKAVIKLFRKMRRSRQELSYDECVKILERGKTAVLGLIGDGGYPYTVPVNYVFRGGKFYFHCAKTGHKLDAIAACDKVSVCVIDRDDVVAEKLTTYFRSVILFGRARIIDDEAEACRAVFHLGMKYLPDKEAVEKEIEREHAALCCVEITPEHISGKEAIELLRAENGQPKI